MKIRVDAKEKKKLIAAVFCASLSGLLNGLFGAGGGILLTYMFLRLSRNTGDAFASVVMTVALMSIVSARRYFAMGSVDIEMLEGLVVPAVVGGYLGAWLSGRMNGSILRIIFAVMLVISGINMAI